MKGVVEKNVKYYVQWAHKNRKKVTFKSKGFTWVHLRKESFLEKHKLKLMPRGDRHSKY